MTTNDPRSLLDKFAPIVYFEPQETSFPSSVEWYLERTRLAERAGSAAPLVTRLDPTKDAATLTGAYHNNASDWFLLHTGTSVRGGQTDLSRVPCYGMARPVGMPVSAYDLTYHFFFPFNGNIFDLEKTLGLLGDINGAIDSFPPLLPLRPLVDEAIRELRSVDGIEMHEGDWEHVTVRVTADGQRILGIYFAAHDGGNWYLRAVRADSGARDGFRLTRDGRPIVYSARQSHASYPYAGKTERFGGLADDHTGAGPRWDTRGRIVDLGGDAANPPPGLEWLKYKDRWGMPASKPLALTEVVAALAGEFDAALRSVPGIGDAVAGLLNLKSVESLREYVDGPTGPSAKKLWTAGERDQSTVPIMAPMKARWMELLGEQIAGAPLETLTLPGTHDAGTYSITADSDLSPDTLEPPWSTILGQFSDVKQLFADWGKAQGQSALRQMELGSRYLDLRIARKGSQLRICHGLYGADIREVLDDVRGFLDQNRREVVILDFQRFYDMEVEHHQALLDLVYRTFEGLLVPRERGPGVPLRDLWARDERVIVTYGKSELLATNPLLWSRSGALNEGDLSSPWPDAQSAGELEDKLDKYVEARRPGRLFVVQGVLTPDGGMIAAGMTAGAGSVIDTVTGVVGIDTNVEQPDSLRDLARKASPKVAQWAKDDWKRRTLGVLMVDWLGDHPEVADVAIARDMRPDPWTAQFSVTDKNGAQTSDMPALAVFQDRLVLAYRGEDSSNLYCCTFDGASWSGQARITDKNGAKSSHGPSLAVHKDRLWMAYRGEGSSKLYVCWYDGTKWSDQICVTEKNGARTSDTPSLAVLNNRLYLAYRGEGSSSLYCCSLGSLTWSDQVCITDANGARAGNAPALFAHDGLLFLAYKGEGSSDLWVCTSDGPRWYHQSNLADVLGARTSQTPAMASHEGRLHLVYRGEGPDIWSCSFAGGQWSFQGHVTAVNGAKTSRAPALAVLRDRLYLAFRGESSSTLRGCSMPLP